MYARMQKFGNRSGDMEEEKGCDFYLFTVRKNTHFSLIYRNEMT